ncbi:MAG: HAD hydrolase family protein [Duncaniella sp.]|nr:HAD hydrolase family protein [Duncaniella sp.]
MSRILFATDLDGTLLGPDGKVSGESARIISDLSRQGALITVATARTPATVEPLLRDTFTTVPAIVLTGAALWDRTGRRFIDPMTIPADVAGWLEDTFMQHGIQPFVYNLLPDGTMQVLHSPGLTCDEDRFYIERKDLELKKFIFRHGPFCSGSEYPSILMLGIGDTPSVETLAAQLRPDSRLSVSAYPDIFDHSRSYIEVFRAGISKAAAVLRLKQMLGADRLVVYGDHLNDLSMFAVADESVAMSNALPQVREAATRTIGPNTLPSVASDMAALFQG